MVFVILCASLFFEQKTLELCGPSALGRCDVDEPQRALEGGLRAIFASGQGHPQSASRAFLV
jgi:hypothetical protein